MGRATTERSTGLTHVEESIGMAEAVHTDHEEATEQKA